MMYLRFLGKTAIITIIICSAIICPVSAFTAQDAQLSIDALNKVFWDPTKKCFERYENRSDLLDFWTSAHTWETVMDAYVRSGDTLLRKQIDANYDGFVATRGANWTTNSYNDDIMWWVIACTHAYRITKNQRYLDQAKTHFDWIWKNQTDNVLGGGIYWSSAKQEKNACVNGPGAIAALELGELLNDSVYTNKGKTLYVWLRGHLFDVVTGAVYDHMTTGGTLDKRLFTYNQGTFIGAAQRLYTLTKGQNYLADACKAADFTRSSMSNAQGILRDEGQGDGGAFKLVAVRYIVGLIQEGGQTQYRQWMYDNANKAWANRRKTDNIMGYDWANPISSGTVMECQSSAGAVALMNLLPPEGSTAVDKVTPQIKASTLNKTATSNQVQYNLVGRKVGGKREAGLTTHSTYLVSRNTKEMKIKR